jgi:diguanylate cyclase (GGDEF)-like protein/PAS domain S-box-containing protein
LDTTRQLKGNPNIRDATVRRKAGAPLRGAETLFERAFAAAPIGMALVDMEGRWLEVNDALCRILGRSRDSIAATTLHAVAHPSDAERDAVLLHDLLGGRIASYEVERRHRHAHGHWLWVLVTVSLVRDRRGEPLHFVMLLQDVSERRRLAERLEHLADHDFLTGLFNRRRFQQEVDREAERMWRHGTRGAVLMIDLDRFKAVNDAFGHRAGDELLRGIARALMGRMRRTDVLARVGGDEFAMLLPETDEDRARIVAEGVRETIRRHVAALGGASVRVTASVGIAPFDGVRAFEVMELADRAMYAAKEAGRRR